MGGPMTERERLVEDMARSILRVECDATEAWVDTFWSSTKTEGHKGDCPIAAPEDRAPISCDRCVMNEALDRAEAALSAVLKRHRVVPVEPTEGMLRAAVMEDELGVGTDAWRAMLAASPIQPEGE